MYPWLQSPPSETVTLCYFPKKSLSTEAITKLLHSEDFVEHLLCIGHCDGATVNKKSKSPCARGADILKQTNKKQVKHFIL